MQGLWLSMGLINEMWMCRAEVSGELVQSVVSNKDTGRSVQHAVFSIEVLNCGAAAGRITFAKDFLKVAVQKLNNSIIHSYPLKADRNPNIARCLRPANPGR